jgi:hypothetical protein
MEYWQYLLHTQCECGPFKIYALGEIRFNHDITKFYYSRVAENFSCQLMRNLDLIVSYSFLYKKTRGHKHFSNANRLELELNPSMYLCEGLIVKWRNKMMFLKQQHNPNVIYIFRHRSELNYILENCGPLVAFKCYDEIYYDFNDSTFTQNRFVPIGLTFAPRPSISIDVYFMIRNFRSNLHWYRSFVFYSQLEF